MSALEIFDAILKYGWPTVALCILIYSLYKCAKWFQPRVDRLIDGHMETMLKITNDSARHSEALEEIAECQAKQIELIKIIEEHATQTRNHTKEMARLMGLWECPYKKNES